MGVYGTPLFKFDDVPAEARLSPEWLKHQPFAQLPYLEDTDKGIDLFESRAIVKYIGLVANSPLVPDPRRDDLVTWAKFEQACSVEYSDFEPSAVSLFIELGIKAIFNQPPLEVLVEQHKATLEKKLQGYERMLSSQAYLAGDKMTVADLFHLPHGAECVKAMVQS